jgi:hypothetical protein
MPNTSAATDSSQFAIARGWPLRLDGVEAEAGRAVLAMTRDMVAPVTFFQRSSLRVQCYVVSRQITIYSGRHDGNDNNTGVLDRIGIALSGACALRIAWQAR